MGQVTFSTVFSGGQGNLDIICSAPQTTLSFTDANPGAQSLTLPIGNNILSIRGAAPAGFDDGSGTLQGGNISLSIIGDIPAEIDQNFPGGDIPTHSLILFITS